MTILNIFSNSAKRELDFINFHFAFSISVLFPAFPPWFPSFLLWFPAFLPWFLPLFPAFSPHSSHSHPDSSHFHPAFPPLSLHSHLHSPHFPHSVPRFPIPAFTDSQRIQCLHFSEYNIHWNINILFFFFCVAMV